MLDIIKTLAERGPFYIWDEWGEDGGGVAIGICCPVCAPEVDDLYDPKAHAPDCPWRRAVELLEEKGITL